MSEKINQYVKFIQNEQKRLNSSTVVAPRQLNEAVPFLAPLAIRGGAYLLKKGAEAYAKRQAAKAAAEKAASEIAKKAGEQAVRKGPEGLVMQGTRRVPGKPHYKPGSATEPTPTPTVSPSAPQSLPTPKAEFKGEPLQVGTALVGAAGLLGGGQAIYSGTKQRQEVEAERNPKPEAPTTKEPPKAATEPTKQEQPPKAATEPTKQEPESPEPSKPAEDDEEAEKYLSPLERRARTLKKEAVERLFSIKKPRI